MIRPDISNSLIHLTRDRKDLTSEQVFDKIVSEKNILGSNEYIRGKHNCICFSETPISAIGQILAQESGDFHYGPFGFLFSKKYLFEKGARPVIYQPDSDYKLLSVELQYRHVRFEINNIDWTWEREWRLRTENLKLEPDTVTLIVRDRKKIEEIKTQALSGHDPLSIATSGYLSSKKFEWHFISLSDLGFN